MDTLKSVNKRSTRKLQIRKPFTQGSEEERLWEEVRKFARLVPSESDPNLGRVREIKEEMSKGTYMTREGIEVTAARLASRFMKPR